MPMMQIKRAREAEEDDGIDRSIKRTKVIDVLFNPIFKKIQREDIESALQAKKRREISRRARNENEVRAAAEKSSKRTKRARDEVESEAESSSKRTKLADAPTSSTYAESNEKIFQSQESVSSTPAVSTPVVSTPVVRNVPGGRPPFRKRRGDKSNPRNLLKGARSKLYDEDNLLVPPHIPLPHAARQTFSVEEREYWRTETRANWHRHQQARIMMEYARWGPQGKPPHSPDIVPEMEVIKQGWQRWQLGPGIGPGTYTGLSFVINANDLPDECDSETIIDGSGSPCTEIGEGDYPSCGKSQLRAEFEEWKKERDEKREWEDSNQELEKYHEQLEDWQRRLKEEEDSERMFEEELEKEFENVFGGEDNGDEESDEDEDIEIERFAKARVLSPARGLRG